MIQRSRGLGSAFVCLKSLNIILPPIFASWGWGYAYEEGVIADFRDVGQADRRSRVPQSTLNEQRQVVESLSRAGDSTGLLLRLVYGRRERGPGA